MSAFVKLDKQDVYITPYTAHKSFSIDSSSFEDTGIEKIYGESGSIPFSEGSTVYYFPSLASGGYPTVGVYQSIKHLYYSGFSESSYVSHSYENYLHTSEHDEYRTIGSNVSGISIPKSLYGDSIKPGSVKLTGSLINAYDSNGYLYQSGSNEKIGDVIYKHGMILITDEDYYEAVNTISESLFTGTVNTLATGSYTYSSTEEIFPNISASNHTYSDGRVQSILFTDILQDQGIHKGGEYPEGYLTGSSANELPFIIGDISKVDDTALAEAIGNLSDVFEVTNIEYVINIAETTTDPNSLGQGVEFNEFTSDDFEDNVALDTIKLSGADANTLTNEPDETVYKYFYDITGSFDYKYADISPIASSTLTLESGTWPTGITTYGRGRITINGETYKVLSRDSDTQITIDRPVTLPAGTSFSLTSNQVFPSLAAPLTLEFKNTYSILTHNYNCKISQNQLNFSQNPSSYTNTEASGSIINNITGSEFQPYITTVGLYNDANELVAVGKLGQPIPKSQTTDMTFKVRIDM